MTERGARASGTVLRAVGGVYDVALDSGEVVEAALRGRLRLDRRTGDSVVAGDRVEIERGSSSTIEVVQRRRSELARRAPGHGGRRAKVIVANVDQVVVVFAAAYPEPRLRMLDRFLVIAESNRLPVLIVLNKIDLAAAEGESVLQAYEDAGYEVLRTSVPMGIGLDRLRERLCERESVLTGPSGVGKSSLLNALQPDLGLRVASVSEASAKGRHTTVAAQLIPLDCGGYVADTPGLRELGLWGIELNELSQLFPELRARAEECRFGGSCAHVHEPDCAVREAVAAGEIARARYESYLALREDDLS